MIEAKKVKQYYQQTVQENSDGLDALLKQVGKTFLGETISENMLMVIIDSIKFNLSINANDEVIDLGCANGLITINIANSAKYVFGYDLSTDLIAVAKKNHQKKNITYSTSNILDIDFNEISRHKIYMYEVLQHFEYGMLRKLLDKLIIELDFFSLFIGSIPDKNKILMFYDTDERKGFLFNEVLEGSKTHLGNWWYRDHILLLCKELGIRATIIEQDKELHTAHYRFDVLIEKRK